MDFTVFVVVTQQISHRMLDHIMIETIDAILQFYKCFHLSQNVSHLNLFKQMRAEKHLFKVEVTIKNGYDS